jgi:glutathione S-transferase
MATKYRIFGSELSPYSVKIRSYLRYKNIPYEWVVKGSWNMEEFSKLAKLPLIPLVVTPSDAVLQDSTPIIEHIESQYPSPSIHPKDESLKFISALIEEYGDEWGNKLMFHFRWWHSDDRNACARVLAYSRVVGDDEEEIEKVTASIAERMVTRRHFTGSSKDNAPLIKRYLNELLSLLEHHLSSHRYLLGERPAFADFGLAPQIYELASDPTGGGIIKNRAPHTLAWSQRMLEPKNEGDFLKWEDLEPTLGPILYNVGNFFLPWSSANTNAIKQNKDLFSVDLDSEKYTQNPQKYHAKSLASLKERFQAVRDRKQVERILENYSCLKWLI